jgi:RimJ/RimL family protein N-acetyltransferase
MGTELTTERLRLRVPRDEDLQSIVEYRSLPEVARLQGWDESFSLEDAQRLLETRSIEPKTSGWLQLVIEEISAGAVVGDIGVHFVENQPDTIEVGITLAPEHQGKGFGVESLTEVVRWAFEDLDSHRVYGETDDLNVGMRKLFERVGFRLEARLVEGDWFKGAWSTLCVYAMLSSEWPEAR